MSNEWYFDKNIENIPFPKNTKETFHTRFDTINIYSRDKTKAIALVIIRDTVSGDPADNVHNEEALYNAELISRAPKLLEFLNAFICSTGTYNIEMTHDEIQNAKSLCKDLTAQKNKISRRKDLFVEGDTVEVSLESIRDSMVEFYTQPYITKLISPIKVTGICPNPETPPSTLLHTQIIEVTDATGRVETFSGYWFKPIIRQK
jgi:hypothetical protein